MLGNGFQNIFKVAELKRRVIYTFLLLVVYRIGVHVPTPGVNAEAIASFLKSKGGTLLEVFGIFTGGALEKMSVFTLGIMPYISSSIIFSLLTVVIPALEQLSKEGEAGRKKITRYTRYGTILLGIIQSYMISMGLENMAPDGVRVVLNPGWSFQVMTVITLTAGTAFIMWLGEQITERGIGNGISLIIFAGIVARLPTAALSTLKLVGIGQMSVFLILILLVCMVGVIGVIVFGERGQRRIPVQYAKRIVGRRVYGGQSTHLPLKINMSGVIPPIFASSILLFPGTIASFLNVPWLKSITEARFSSVWYNLLYVGCIIFFAYFYTAVTFNTATVAENMKKNGGYIPGIRPGRRTADYIEKILSRLTLIGALYISAICVLPTILIGYVGVPFYFGGTALLIVVGVAIDTASQMESHMMARHYEGFMKTGAIRGRMS
ncbi:MAG: preprotein translocase subunit SecY [Pseudomonadota bacterium]